MVNRDNNYIDAPENESTRLRELGNRLLNRRIIAGIAVLSLVLFLPTYFLITETINLVRLVFMEEPLESPAGTAKYFVALFTLLLYYLVFRVMRWIFVSKPHLVSVSIPSSAKKRRRRSRKQPEQAKPAESERQPRHEGGATSLRKTIDGRIEGGEQP